MPITSFISINDQGPLSARSNNLAGLPYGLCVE